MNASSENAVLWARSTSAFSGPVGRANVSVSRSRGSPSRVAEAKLPRTASPSVEASAASTSAPRASVAWVAARVVPIASTAPSGVGSASVPSG